MDIVIRYIFKHRFSGNIEIKKYSTSQLEAWGAKKLSPCFNETDYELIARNLFTGLVDKNGVWIYEGDILKRTVTIVMYGTGKPPEDIDEYLEVQYREEYAGFFIGERSLFAYVDTIIDVDTRCSCTKAEVVGNIYQNTDLLESAQ